MPAVRLTEYLDTQQIKYITLEHSTAYTSQEVAQSAHIRGKMLAKSVILNIDNRMSMMVLPASYRVDLADLKHSIRSFKLELATEKEFKDLFATCELGALPPFGNLYGMDVYIADCLTEEPEITFCAGTHSELIQMHYQDYQRLVKPMHISHGAIPLGATPPRMRVHAGLFR
jgi:Ala-tRNA(Pro) deacylase